MRTVVVNTERDFAELRNRVVRPGVTAARLRSVEDSIRAANPHLNLDRLQPGAVVVLPDHPDVAGEAAGAGTALDAVGAALPGVRDTVQRSAREASRRGEGIAKVLTSREVIRAGDADKALRTELTRLGAAAAEEQRRAAEWAHRVDASTAGWQRAMEELRRLT